MAASFRTDAKRPGSAGRSVDGAPYSRESPWLLPDAETMKTPFIVMLALLAGCAARPDSELPTALKPEAAPAAAQTAAAADAPAPRLERHEASAQCWMRHDKSGGSLEAKAKLVEKCINDKMAGIDKQDTNRKLPRQ